METSLKTGFAQISFFAQKIWVAQTLGGLQPPSPPARTPMSFIMFHYSMTELNIFHSSFFFATRDAFDMADPSTMQDVRHIWT